MTIEPPIVTIEYLARAAKWIDTWVAYLRRELEFEREMYPDPSEDYPIEVRVPEAKAELLITGLEKTAEALRIVITDNQQRKRDLGDPEAKS
jgi:hypothetical protein